ncbi:MAG TPA: type III-A CRISPR-associated protein Cas10/Csm1, partial [Thermoplasmataceae archaeon]|nr:type III-A CRISPR-associated protein Cas10/Csm1 [Thermoplasmataceae archaeon]
MPENDSDEFALALAALLHDVGKVAQRYTPGETHQSLGSRFVLNLGTIPERVRKDVSTLVKLHHEKEVGKLGLPHQMENLLAILKKADHASASHDREDRDPDAFKSEPRMEKIYRYVNINSADKRDARYFPLVTVSSLRSSVSEDGRFQFKDITYEKIYKDLLRIVEKIPYREPRSYFNTLDSVLMEYLTFVPSAFYYSKPNITLYDHLRLTAALAVSLHRTKKSSSAGKLVLIMGEASGIQQYIFNSMVSEGVDDKATKRMRGRSFMVRLATDAVVSYLLSQLDLFRFNVVWQKADGFLIIAPFSDDIVGKLELIRDAVDRSFLNLNRGIKVSLGFQTVGIEDLGENENEEFRLVLAKLSMEISKSKVKPLS